MDDNFSSNENNSNSQEITAFSISNSFEKIKENMKYMIREGE